MEVELLVVTTFELKSQKNSIVKPKSERTILVYSRTKNIQYERETSIYRQW